MAAVRETKWFRTHSDTWRQMEFLRRTDPKTYDQRHKATAAQIRDLAGASGATLSGKQLSALAHNAMNFGWNESQLRDVMAGYVRYRKGTDILVGEAGKVQEQIQSLARQYGVTSIKGNEMLGWVQSVLRGDRTIEEYQNIAQLTARRMWTAYADDIDKGVTPMQIAAPLINSMAQVLEVNPENLDLYDPTIRRAMQYINPQSGKPQPIELWKFETDLRKDSRWLKTNNAR
jgi:hypothetical protein